jgi:hypothetical protein
MHKHGKKDTNHNAIAQSCRDIGATVLDMSSLGDGAPDFCAGYRGRNCLFEVKRDRKAKLTQDQRDFHLLWNGKIHTVTTGDEATDILLGRIDMQKIKGVIQRPSPEPA